MTRSGASEYISTTKARSKGKTENESFPGNLRLDSAMRTRQTPSCKAANCEGVSSTPMVRERSKLSQLQSVREFIQWCHPLGAESGAGPVQVRYDCLPR